jgi:lysophospholipase L1-like esterase
MKADILLGRIFLSLIAMTLAFLLADFLSHRFITSRSPIEQQFPVQRFRHPKPYVMFGGLPDSRGLNSLGYRGPAPPVLKLSSDIRVFMLGGSTVLMGKPPIATLLEQQFHGNGMDNVRVYNFGVLSSVSGMELTRIVHELPELQPDLIIFYNGANDFDHPFEWDPRPGYPFNSISYERNPLLENDITQYPTMTLLAYGSNLLRWLAPGFFVERFIALDEERRIAGWMTEEWRARIASVYVNNLVKADRLSRAFGAEFIGFFQPVLYYKNHLTDKEERIFKQAESDHARDMRKRITAKMTAASRSNPEIHLVDLSRFFEDITQRIFRDRVHTTQLGKQMIADEMFRQIVSRDLIR